VPAAPCRPHHSRGVCAHDLRILGVALVRATPAIVANHCYGRCEHPVDARHRHFLRGRRSDALDQVWIVSGAERAVVREEGGADHVVVTVNGIGAPDDGNRGRATRRVHRGVVVLIRQRDPVTDR